MSAHKNDSEKDPWHLAPWDAFRAIVKVIGYGAKKYQPRDWEDGMAWSRQYSALMRHMTAWWEGELVDPESGHPHLWHAGACAAILIAYDLRGGGADDRPKCRPSEHIKEIDINDYSTVAKREQLSRTDARNYFERTQAFDRLLEKDRGNG